MGVGLDILCGTSPFRRAECDRLIASLDRNARLNWHLWLADLSPEPAPLYAPAHPRVTVIREWPRRGVSMGYNVLAMLGPKLLGYAPYLAWLNDDVEVEPDWDAAAVAALEAHPGAGLAACYQLDPRMKGWRVHEYPARTPKRAGLLYANFGILPRHVFEAVGGFDPRVRTYACDNALAFRVQHAGRYVLAVPESRVVHHYADDAARRLYMNRPDGSREPGGWLDVYAEWHPHLTRLLATQGQAPERPLVIPAAVEYAARFGVAEVVT